MLTPKRTVGYEKGNHEEKAENPSFLKKINSDKNEIPFIEKIKEVVTVTSREASWDSLRIPTTRNSHSQPENVLGRMWRKWNSYILLVGK